MLINFIDNVLTKRIDQHRRFLECCRKQYVRTNLPCWFISAFPHCRAWIEMLELGNLIFQIVVEKSMSWIAKLPLLPLLIVALALGLAPFYPEPHLWEKLKMLVEGTLVRPIDIFDLLLHASAPLLLLLKLLRMALNTSA